MKYRNLLMALAAITYMGASAETVLLYETFNDGDYNKSFPLTADVDGYAPHHSIASIFLSSSSGNYEPWWIARDTNTATDLYYVSHSYYENAPQTSNDWFVSVPLTIDTEGYVLSFDAQSVPVRGLDRLSSLNLYISETLPEYYVDLPTEVTTTFADIPYGNDPDNCENDWTRYEYGLDDYVGKTIYLFFANQDTDKDILAIDNVKVSRSSAAEFALNEYSQYVVEEEFEFGATLTGVEEAGLINWTVTLSGAGQTKSWTGESLSKGEIREFAMTIPVDVDQPTEFTATVEAENMAAYTITGAVTRLAFKPVTRIFAEETTGLWCGNCPAGMQTFENLERDPQFKDRFLPVSVHISMNGGLEPMEDEEYASLLGITAAPMVLVNRTTSTGFNIYNDGKYDPDNQYSFAYRMRNELNRLSMMDVDVTAEWIVEGADTVGVKCSAEVRPAITLKGGDYRLGFVLTENNVGIDNNPLWRQENYLSGLSQEYGWDNWAQLPEKVSNLRYHDVARHIDGFAGIKGSLPKTLLCGETYRYEHIMTLPDKEVVMSSGLRVSDAIRTDFCEITAFVLDAANGQVVNAARYPIGQYCKQKYTVEDYIKQYLGIAAVDADASGPVEYYDMQGRKLQNPASGTIVVRKQGTQTKLVIMH